MNAAQAPERTTAAGAFEPPAPRAGRPGPTARASRPRAVIPGIGEALPEGESLLWTGSPVRHEVARRVCHARGVLWYFGGLGALVLAGGVSDGSVRPSLAGAAILLAMGATVFGFAHVYAALVARTTVYALTERRLVLRIGVAIPAVLNVPLEQIESVDLRGLRRGAGDITVTLGGSVRLAYLLLWPHARPWRYSRPEPALRGIADAGVVGGLLADAVRARLAQLEADAQHGADATSAQEVA